MSAQSFVSRLAFVQNLKNTLQHGHSAIMTGGPMIGKTTLTDHLADLFQNDPASHTAVRIALEQMQRPADFWGFLMEAILSQLMGPDQKNPYRKSPDTLGKVMTQIHYLSEKQPDLLVGKKLVLLIDDCDRLLPDAAALIPQIENMRMELMAPSVEAICWIGGLSWLDWVDTHMAHFMGPLRRYPLATVPIREARSIIRQQLGAEKVDQVWSETGGHPFLLERSFGGAEGFSLDDFNERIWSGLKAEEKAILAELDPGGAWQILDDLKMENGIKPPKALLDRLCMAGLVVRTLDHGTAVVRMTSPLIRDP